MDRRPQWSALPDGPCEHVAAHLSRHAQLACRLVCRSWAISFVHALAPLTVDTRFFATCNASSTSSSALPRPLGEAHSLGPAWDSLTEAVGPTLRAFTVRISLHHESKARASPCADSLVACLRYLASLPQFTQERLQLLLPMRYALPEAATDLLSAGLCRLRMLRVVRCSLTQQLAGVLGSLPHLRHLCIAHANLAALPQLLAAATQLEHIHVHGYHSLVIVEDNAHQLAAWREAVSLVARSRQHRRQPGQLQAHSQGPEGQLWPPQAPPDIQRGIDGSEAFGGNGSGSAGGSEGDLQGSPAAGRLRCLAVSAHHQYHDTVLDEAELGFEAEALRWQIRYDSACDDWARFRSPSPRGPGQGGPVLAGGTELGWAPAAGMEDSQPDDGPGGDGCWPDVRQDPGGRAACGDRCNGGGSGCNGVRGGRGTYMGSGCGGTALCAAALLSLRCECCATCCCGHPAEQRLARPAQVPSPPAEKLRIFPWPSLASRGGAPAGPVDDEAGGQVAGLRGPGGPGGLEPQPQPLGHGGPWRLGSAGGTTGMPANGATLRGLQLLKSAKREVQLRPLEALRSDTCQPHWQHLQYVQLSLVQGPDAALQPPPPPPLALARARTRAQLPRAGAPGSSSDAPVEGTASICGAAAAAAGEAGARPSDEARDLSDQAASDLGGNGADVSLEALNEVPSLTGVWLDPDEWDGEAEVLAPEEARSTEASGAAGQLDGVRQGGRVGGAAATTSRGEDNLDRRQRQPQERPLGQHHGAQPEDQLDPGLDPGLDLGRQPEPASATRWGLVGDVWVRLHDSPPWDPGATRGTVQDAFSHAALLTRCTGLRSLALGDRRTPFLGVGDDTAALLAGLQGLTRLHLSAAYTLPLEDSPPPLAAPYQPPPPTHAGGTWPSPPPQLPLPPVPRLAPLGALTTLQRLNLHFSNPLGRLAVVSQAALPTSLTSLSLHGVLLFPAESRPLRARPQAALAPLLAQGGVPATIGTDVRRLDDAGQPRTRSPGHGWAGGVARPLSVPNDADADRTGGSREATAEGRVSDSPDADMAGTSVSRDGAARDAGCASAPLTNLRELFLTSSYLVRADLLCCGRRLAVLSLVDSGVGVGCGRTVFLPAGWEPRAAPAHGPPRPEPVSCRGGEEKVDAAEQALQGESEGEGSGGVARLLRDWYQVQTLKVVGSLALPPAALLPGDTGGCLDWFSSNSLLAITRCLPGLQALHLAAPPTAGGAGAPAGLGDPVRHSKAAASSSRSEVHLGGPKGQTAPLAASPTWNLTSIGGIPALAGPTSCRGDPGLPERSRAFGAGAEVPAATCVAGSRLTDSYKMGERVEDRDEDLLAAPEQEPRTGFGGSLPGPGWKEARSASGKGGTPLGPQVPGLAGPGGPHGGSQVPPSAPSAPSSAASPAVDPITAASVELGASDIVGPGDWLTLLLASLCCHAPHVSSLRLSGCMANWQCAERAVRAACSMLPSVLVHLEQLTLVIDLALLHVLDQPQPEQYSRAWAAWLKEAEADLQARMRYTCVSVSAEPRSTSRVRDILRHRAAVA